MDLTSQTPEPVDIDVEHEVSPGHIEGDKVGFCEYYEVDTGVGFRAEHRGVTTCRLASSSR